MSEIDIDYEAIIGGPSLQHINTVVTSLRAISNINMPPEFKTQQLRTQRDYAINDIGLKIDAYNSTQGLNQGQLVNREVVLADYTYRLDAAIVRAGIILG